MTKDTTKGTSLNFLEALALQYKALDNITPDTEGFHIKKTFDAIAEANNPEAKFNFTEALKQVAAPTLSEKAAYFLDNIDVSKIEPLVQHSINKTLTRLGLDVQAIMKDGSIDKTEFATIVAAAGEKALNDIDPDSPLHIPREELTEENYGATFEQARNFADKMEVDLTGKDHVLTGLAALHITMEKAFNTHIEKRLTIPDDARKSPDVHEPKALDPNQRIIM